MVLGFHIRVDAWRWSVLHSGDVNEAMSIFAVESSILWWRYDGVEDRLGVGCGKCDRGYITSHPSGHFTLHTVLLLEEFWRMDGIEIMRDQWIVFQKGLCVNWMWCQCFCFLNHFTFWTESLTGYSLSNCGDIGIIWGSFLMFLQHQSYLFYSPLKVWWSSEQQSFSKFMFIDKPVNEYVSHHEMLF